MTAGSIEDCTVEWIDVFDLRLFNGWKSELKIVLSKRLPEKRKPMVDSQQISDTFKKIPRIQ